MKAEIIEMHIKRGSFTDLEIKYMREKNVLTSKRTRYVEWLESQLKTERDERYYVALVYYKQHKDCTEHHIKVSTAKADSPKHALEKAIKFFDEEFEGCVGYKRANFTHVIKI